MARRIFYPRRGDEVEKFIKTERDKYDGSYHESREALDDLLDNIVFTPIRVLR